MMNDEKILLLGDVHGASGWLRLAISAANALGVTHILQLGDFGFWPHYPSGQEFLRKTQNTLDENGVELWWIDGNHENHDWLSEVNRSEDGFWRDGNITHIGRGSRWEWGGRTFLGCGGAYSIDKPYRREGESWWAGETITEADLMRCSGPMVDVLATHDAPVDAMNIMGPGTVGDKDSYPESFANRQAVAALVVDVCPSLLVHGHYHHRNTTTARNGATRVEGFGRDGDALGSMAVLDLTDLSVTNVNPYVVVQSAGASTTLVDDNF